MAQAETIPTTRRAFSKWLMAAPVAVALPMPTFAAPVCTLDWDAFELELAQTIQSIKEFDGKIAVANKGFAAWEARNPWPTEPDYDSHQSRIADAKRLNRELSAHTIRYQNAIKQCGRGKLTLQRNKVLEQYETVLTKIAETPARSLADIKAKSRVARLEVTGGPIAPSILKDLLNI